jgi:hypothetical protein
MSELDSIDTDLLAKRIKEVISLKGISMGSNLPVVIFDQGHSQAWSVELEVAKEINSAHPEDSSYAKAFNLLKEKGFEVGSIKGLISKESLQGVDVLVIPHNAVSEYEKVIATGSPVYQESELKIIEEFVKLGGGLLILSEHEINKYGGNIGLLIERLGVKLNHDSIQDKVSNHNGVAFWPKMRVVKPNLGISARVREAAVYRSGSITKSEELDIILEGFAGSDPSGAVAMVGKSVDEGYVILSGDSDIFGDDSIDDYDHRELFYSLVNYLGASKFKNGFVIPIAPKGWDELRAAVEELRLMQDKYGCINEKDMHDRADALVQEMKDAIIVLKPEFPHDDAYLEMVLSDLTSWAKDGFLKPDFSSSLEIFRPETQRRDGLKHLVVFPMYTQNGNPNINFEALIITTYWPSWLAEMEANGYDNKGFLTIMLEFATSGYNNHCATLFPETVSASNEIKFTWGAIFADRESARFRKVALEASKLTKLDVPGDMWVLLKDALLAQEVFALWDLVHDRTHMHGDLPFDPFMIKQRSPYWMYALEELRCDLNSYKEAGDLFKNGFAHGRLVMYSILFDRIFRFAVTGARVRNYDGLGGQILFSHLHKAKVINWRDNILSIDWLELDNEIEKLRVEIEELYRKGINSPKLVYWQNAYKLVSNIVEVSPSSKWQKDNFDFSRSQKEILDDIQDDEFPLSLFHEALAKKIAPTIEQCSGIKGSE